MSTSCSSNLDQEIYEWNPNETCCTSSFDCTGVVCDSGVERNSLAFILGGYGGNADDGGNTVDVGNADHDYDSCFACCDDDGAGHDDGAGDEDSAGDSGSSDDDGVGDVGDGGETSGECCVGVDHDSCNEDSYGGSDDGSMFSTDYPLAQDHGHSNNGLSNNTTSTTTTITITDVLPQTPNQHPLSCAMKNLNKNGYLPKAPQTDIEKYLFPQMESFIKLMEACLQFEILSRPTLIECIHRLEKMSDDGENVIL
eukprot:TRINITY_DN3699_c1_g4_i2.p1 TRINITY_DN3699_c1_g4~~TRINITY_DN3699_c1_g4_i2.p1  ORF type:complete len:277 (+),score=99.21 TRINITY_DN3699_c1_g4_i2:70-831(+)